MLLMFSKDKNSYIFIILWLSPICIALLKHIFIKMIQKITFGFFYKKLRFLIIPELILSVCSIEINKIV